MLCCETFHLTKGGIVRRDVVSCYEMAIFKGKTLHCETLRLRGQGVMSWRGTLKVSWLRGDTKGGYCVVRHCVSMREISQMEK